MKKYNLASIGLKIVFVIIAIFYTFSMFLIIHNDKEIHWLLIVLCLALGIFFDVCTVLFCISKIIIKDGYLLTYGFNNKKYEIKNIKEIKVSSNEIYIRYKGKIHRFSGYQMFRLIRCFSQKEENKTIEIVNDILSYISKVK